MENFTIDRYQCVAILGPLCVCVSGRNGQYFRLPSRPGQSLPEQASMHAGSVCEKDDIMHVKGSLVSRRMKLSSPYRHRPVCSTTKIDEAFFSFSDHSPPPILSLSSPSLSSPLPSPQSLCLSPQPPLSVSFFFFGYDKDLEGKGCCKRKQMNHVVNAGPVILCYGIFSRAEIKFRASSNNKSRWQGSLVE